MNRTRSWMLAVLAAAIGAGMGLAALAADRSSEKQDIVDTAAGAKDFSTLVTAIKAADLVEALKGEGPFTVFAPTNEAFAKIPKDKLAALLKDKDALTAVLTYHVVPGKVMAADVVKLTEADTLQGEPVKIRVADGKVSINDAEVTKTDIECTNGVIHVIDAVLMPPQ
jgi:uncharacterized surface protein with fasciclin (FAS1) repeats